jgi:hypothetical protein
LEPDPARCERVPPEEIDAIVLPCVAFDKENRRLDRAAAITTGIWSAAPRGAHRRGFRRSGAAAVAANAEDMAVDMVVTE